MTESPQEMLSRLRKFKRDGSFNWPPALIAAFSEAIRRWELVDALIKAGDALADASGELPEHCAAWRAAKDRAGE